MERVLNEKMKEHTKKEKTDEEQDMTKKKSKQSGEAREKQEGDKGRK